MLEQTVDNTSRDNKPWAGGTREVRGPHGAGSARGARVQLGASDARRAGGANAVAEGVAAGKSRS